MRNTFILFTLLITLFASIDASHFRFGTINWRPASAAQYNTINFYVNLAFRWDYPQFNYPTVGETISVGTMSFGDPAKTTVTIFLTVSAIDTELDWLSGYSELSFTYPTTPANYTAYHTDCCRISSLINNHDLPYVVSTRVNVGLFQNIIDPNTGLVTGSEYNHSPVSNNLPIVRVFLSTINTFNIVASDDEDAPLTYQVVSGVYGVTLPGFGGLVEPAPATFLVNASTGQVSFDTRTTIVVGLYMAQVLISDGPSWAVVDFILNVTTPVLVCDASCNNAGSTCTQSSQCLGCNYNINGGVVCGPAFYPYFIAPTPAAGSTVLFQVGKMNTVVVTGVSPSSLLSVTILPGSIPPGSSWSPQVGTNPANMTLSWAPTISALGNYVITLALRDSNGQNLQNSQQSFIISVYSICGNGAPDAQGNCVCLTGYTVASKCLSCSPGYYGPNCLACPNCNNGQCVDGSQGTGTCICNGGWTGNYCNQTVSVVCNPSASSQIVNTIAGSGMVTTEVATFISTTAPALPIPITVNIPTTLGKFDLLLLLQVDKSITSDKLGMISDYSKSLIDSITKSTSYNIQWGLATFTDSPTCSTCSSADFIFDLNYPLSPDNTGWTTMLSSLTPNTNLGGSDSNSCQLNSLLAAATSPSVGWRSDAFKVVLLVTDSGYNQSPTAGGYTTVAAVQAALIANNIVPIVLCTDHTLYDGLISSLGFGISQQTNLNSNFANWYSLAQTSISTVTATVTPVVSSDAYSFIKTVGATQISSAGSTVTYQISMAYPSSGTINANPTAAVTTMGFGVTSFTIQINHAPVATVTSALLPRHTNATFSLYGTDADQNILTGTFLTLPQGSVYTSSSLTTLVTTNTPYPISTQFFYIPSGYNYGTYTFTYSVYDGCLSSVSPGSGTITVQWVAVDPFCQTFSVSTNQNTQVTIGLNGTSVDDPPSSISGVVWTLPSSSAGALTTTTGATVTQLQTINTVVFVPKTNVFGPTSFTYRVLDGALYSDLPACTVNINVVHVDQPSVTVGSTPVTAVRTVPLTITMGSSDPDSPSTSTFTVTSITAGSGGKFTYGASNAQITSTPLPICTNVATTNGAASCSIYYTAPATATGNSYAMVSWTATDNAGHTTAAFTTVINIQADVPPVATALTLTFNEDTSNNALTISGTDSDVADTLLKAVLVSLPSHGTLSLSGTVLTLSNLNVQLSSNNLLYTPTPLYNGTDSFTFKVADMVNVLSAQQTASITIKHVNHAPTVSFSSHISASENMNVTVTNIATNDIDGDRVYVYISVLPVQGNVYQFNGALINSVPTMLTDSQNRFIYLPEPLYAYGNNFANISIYGTDNNTPNPNSPVVIGTIDVSHVNQPPTVSSFTVPIQENTVGSSQSPTLFTLNAADVDNTPAQVSVLISSLPDSSIVTLVDGSGHALAIGATLTTPYNVYANLVQYKWGVTTFGFRASDGSANSLTTATATINVTFVNTVPTCSYSPTPSSPGQPIAALRGGDTTISLTLFDPDVQQKFSIIITSLNQTSGTLTHSSNAISTAPYTVVSNVASTNNYVTANLVFATALSDGGPISNFTFTVQDNNNPPASSQCLIQINVQPDNPPDAFSVAPQTVNECPPTSPTQTSNIVLSGWDQDPGDNATLRAIVQNLPVNGTLYNAESSTAIISPNTIISGNTVYYVPNAYTYGTDSFTFAMMDTVGLASQPETVSITTTYVYFPPVASFVGSVVTLENQEVTITGITGNDPADHSPLTAWISVLPTSGTLYQYSASLPLTAINTVPTQITDSSFRVIFDPVVDTYGSPYTNFSFYVDNGHLFNSKSDNVATQISVTHVNQPPTVTSFEASFEQNSGIQELTLIASDIDTDSVDIYVYLTSLPSSSLVQITNSDGSPIAIGDHIPYPWAFNITPISGTGEFGLTSFTYFSNDGSLASLDGAVVTINITEINLPPSVSATTPVEATREVSLQIILKASDPQPPDVFSFVVYNYNAGSPAGTFYYGSTPFPSSTPFTIATGISSDDGQTNISYVAPSLASGLNYASVSFMVYDSGNAASTNNATVYINIAPNNPPIGDSLDEVVSEDGQSSPIPLDGTDPDVADQGHLLARITSLPLNGQILDANNMQVLTVNVQHNAPYSVIYKPAPLFFGEDSFSFEVLDLLGSLSEPTTVNLSIYHINHRPDGLVYPFTGTENLPVSITLGYTDVDPNTTATAWVSVLPSIGTLYDSNGDAFPSDTSSSSPSPVNGWTLSYSPPEFAHGSIAWFVSFVNDGSGDIETEDSDPINSTISFTWIDQPPSSQNMSISTNQSIPVTFTLPATDIDSTAITATILTFPTRGSLSRLDGSAVSPSSPSVSDRTLIYAPPYGGSDKDVPSGTPYDSFTFVVIDDSLVSSLQSYTVNIGVNPDHPPPEVIADPNVFTIIDNTTLLISTYQNQDKVISLKGKSIDWTSYSMMVVQTVTNGTLYQSTCSLDGCTYIPITNNVLPFSITGEDPYQVKYTPPFNIWGDRLDYFDFYFYDPNGDSETWRVYITVIHVNAPPAVVPFVYSLYPTNITGAFLSPWSTTLPIVGFENMELLIQWNISDIDSPQDGMTSQMVQSPLKGTMYSAYTDENGVIQRGDPLVIDPSDNTAEIPRDVNGNNIWSMIFAGNQDDWGVVYGTFAVRATDNQQAQSIRVPGVIRIKAVNEAPYVTISDSFFNGTDVDTLIISNNQKVTDPDCGFSNIFIQVWISRDDGMNKTTENITLASTSKTCTYNQSIPSVSCTDTNAKLNQYLSQITLNGLVLQVNYTLTIYVNDLGAGADPSEKSNLAYHLSANGTIRIFIYETPDYYPGASPASNNNAMTGLIAGGAAAGAGAAAAVYAFLKKRKGIITNFFGDDAFANSFVSENPLYQGDAAVSFDNPLFNES